MDAEPNSELTNTYARETGKSLPTLVPWVVFFILPSVALLQSAEDILKILLCQFCMHHVSYSDLQLLIQDCQERYQLCCFHMIFITFVLVIN